MEGTIKKIKNTFPVTTTKAVYIDGTDKTLQQAIDNGEIGGSITTATTSGRGYCQVALRGAKVFCYHIPESSTAHSTLKYVFPTGDSDRMRRMYVWTPSGENKSYEIPNGQLSANQALVYNFDTNTVQVKDGTWGNVTVANNEIILLYNDNQKNCIKGALKEYVVDYNEVFIPSRPLPYELCSNEGNGLSQGMFIIGDYMYLWGHSSDDKTTTLGQYRMYSMSDLNTQVGTGTHNLGHMNAPSYSSKKDMMIVANGSKLYDQSSLPMEGWIFPNFKAIMESKPVNIVFNDLEKITLDLSQFTGEYKAQLCWGEDNSDYVYLMTCDNTIVRKLLLAKDELGEYTGEYTIVKEYRSEVRGIVGGFKYFNGCLYTGVKGEYCVRKMKLCDNIFDSTLPGFIQNEYLPIPDVIGATQGLDIYNGMFYVFTDNKGYKIDINKLN